MLLSSPVYPLTAPLPGGRGAIIGVPPNPPTEIILSSDSPRVGYCWEVEAITTTLKALAWDGGTYVAGTLDYRLFLAYDQLNLANISVAASPLALAQNDGVGENPLLQAATTFTLLPGQQIRASLASSSKTPSTAIAYYVYGWQLNVFGTIREAENARR